MAITLGTLLGGCTDLAGPIPSTAGSPGTAGSGPSGTAGSPTVPGGAGMAGMAGSGGGGADLVSFDDEVHPILVAKCGGCHSGEDALPGHGASDPDDAFMAIQGMSIGEPLSERILLRSSGEGGSFMPPGCTALGAAGCLTQDEFDLIELWVDQGASNR
jgi:hypothetical protein